MRHLAFEDLGTLEPILLRRGYDRIDYHDAGVDPRVADEVTDSYDLLVVLGGPIAAEDEVNYPFLAAEVELLRRRLAARRPTLGICLGAQLIARALGWRVRPMAHGRKEIGFAPITLTAGGRDSPLGALSEGVPVLHWHGDEIELPAAVPSLASTRCAQPGRSRCRRPWDCSSTWKPTLHASSSG